jgi:hypothetical protein
VRLDGDEQHLVDSDCVGRKRDRQRVADLFGYAKHDGRQPYGDDNDSRKDIHREANRELIMKKATGYEKLKAFLTLMSSF